VSEHDGPARLDDLYDLIEDIEICMMTTRRPDGYLVSRPMATQPRAAGADLWFATDVSTGKLDELAQDPHVCLAYYREKTREWVSVSGVARVVRDRDKIDELWRPDWRAWFGAEGGGAQGGPDDPRIALLAVEAHSASYLRVDQPRIVTLFEMLRGVATGKRAELGTVREVEDPSLDPRDRRGPSLDRHR
jgi:general stress protein 26